MIPSFVVEIVAIVLLVTLFGVTIYLFGPMRKSKARKVKEIPDDEHANAETVLRLLNRYAATNEFKVVTPVNVQEGKISADLDALLVGWFGVLGVKCLGYGGTVYGQPDEEEWVQDVLGQRRTFKNPLRRAEESARAVREALFEAHIKRVPVETVVVFTGKKTELAVPRSCGHYTVDQFSSYLKSAHFEEDKNVDVDQVAAVFEK